MLLDQIKTALTQSGFIITTEDRTGNNLGTVLRLTNGAVINCWDSGKVNVQGKCKEEVEAILKIGTNAKTTTPRNRNVFVVYGHDEIARTQLDAMLQRWDLKPLIIDQLPSGGQTIIEKLEKYINEADFGIILATPDDIGYPKGKEHERKCRVRQNVVLEMGMLLAKMGRSKVAILLKTTEDMEKPSDIQGLLYMPFTNNVEEIKVSLVKELNNNGYFIDISKL